jgi:3-oxoacyl-[acyl-carrier protein] reductase
MNLQLEKKVAVITGGSRGLGLAAARSLVAEGCDVLICARGEERLAAAARELTALAGGAVSVATMAVDLATPDGPSRVIDEAVKTLGGLDILVNNVGAARGADIETTTDAEWQEAFDHTLFPAVRASRAAVPHLRRRGGGVIVIVSSIYGREAGGRMTYNAVKAAEISLTKSLAQQLARDKIRVVGVAPGSILFPGGSWDKRLKADPDGMAEFVRRELPFGRFGTAEEVGDVIAFLASSRASWISGTTVVVDGCQSRMF